MAFWGRGSQAVLKYVVLATLLGASAGLWCVPDRRRLVWFGDRRLGPGSTGSARARSTPDGGALTWSVVAVTPATWLAAFSHTAAPTLAGGIDDCAGHPPGAGRPPT